jgi:hypothetical protein
MSEKRINTDETVDPRISAAYRDVADECTPEHLDHVILNAARSAAKPRWSKATAWLRPAAWVATIGVCLAIVVEISLLQDQDTAEYDGLREQTEVTFPAEAGRLEKAAPPAAEPSAARPAQKPSPRQSDDTRSRSGEAEALQRMQETEARGAILKDEIGPLQLQSAPAPASADELAEERYCDETQTADPNTWLACILELEQQGLHEAAHLERERLAETFPPPFVR